MNNNSKLIAILLISWFVPGITFWVCAIYPRWKKGEDITVEDFMQLPLTTILGPLLPAVIVVSNVFDYISDFLNNNKINKNTVIIKGSKSAKVLNELKKDC